MKKRFFAIYALVGALVASPIFTSCVDDEESASVTAIRDAKTQELKSIAALKRAQAEAEATIAAAQVALKAAQAEAQVAQEKYYEAQKALQETRNEEAAAQLLITKKQAELDLARIQGEIECQEIAIQTALLNAQADLLNTKQQLEYWTKHYSDKEKNELISLANKYSQSVNELLQAKKDLISMESDLAMYEAGLADAKEGLEETIAGYNKTIAQYNIYIEQYKQYANYTEDLDALKKQEAEAQAAYNLASDKYNAAYQAYWDAQDAVDNDKLNELYQAIEEDAFFQFTRNSQYYDVESESYQHFSAFDWNFTIAIERDDNWNWILNCTYDNYTPEYEYLDYTTWCGDSISYEFEYGMDIRQTELRFAQYMDPIKADIKAAEEAIEADQTTLATAETEATAAKKAWDDAVATEAEDANDKKNAYTAKLAEIEGLNNNIKANQANVETWNKNLAVWASALDMLKNADTYEAALQEKIKAYNDANKAEYAPVVEAWKATVDAEIVMTEADAELQVINALIYGDDWSYSASSIASFIESYENSIKYYQEQIAKAEQLLVNISGNEVAYEEVIAWMKAQVEAQKAVVAAKEVAVADAKAALDAAMPTEEEPEEEGTEEETPAE